MNMFRDILMIALIALALGLGFSDPNDWKWADVAGPYVVQSLSFLATAKPFSIIILFALALALFMTRLKF